jgi:hypothetical protein
VRLPGTWHNCGPVAFAVLLLVRLQIAVFAPYSRRCPRPTGRLWMKLIVVEREVLRARESFCDSVVVRL